MNNAGTRALYLVAIRLAVCRGRRRPFFVLHHPFRRSFFIHVDYSVRPVNLFEVLIL